MELLEISELWECVPQNNQFVNSLPQATNLRLSNKNNEAEYNLYFRKLNMLSSPFEYLKSISKTMKLLKCIRGETKTLHV